MQLGHKIQQNSLVSTWKQHFIPSEERLCTHQFPAWFAFGWQEVWVSPWQGPVVDCFSNPCWWVDSCFQVFFFCLSDLDMPGRVSENACYLKQHIIDSETTQLFASWHAYACACSEVAPWFYLNLDFQLILTGLIIQLACIKGGLPAVPGQDF